MAWRYYEAWYTCNDDDWCLWSDDDFYMKLYNDDDFYMKRNILDTIFKVRLEKTHGYVNDFLKNNRMTR